MFQINMSRLNRLMPKRASRSLHNILYHTKLWKVVLFMIIPGLMGDLIEGIFGFTNLLLVVAFAKYHHLPKETIDMITTANGLVVVIMVSFDVLHHLFTSGASAKIIVSLGKNKKKLANNVFINNLIANIAAGIVAFFLTYFLSVYLIKYQAANYSGSLNHEQLNQAIHEAVMYTHWLAIGVIFFTISSLLITVYRNIARPKLVFTLIFSTIILNIVLNCILLTTTDLTLQAAGFATMGSWIFECLGATAALLFFKMPISLKSFKDYTFSPSLVVGDVLLGSLGLSVMHIGALASSSLMNHYLGEIVIYGTAFQILSLILPTMYGMVHGVSPIVGYNYGYAHFDCYQRIKETLMWFGAVITLYTFIVYFILGFAVQKPLLLSLGVDEKAIPQAEYALHLIMSAAILFLPSAIAMALFQGTANYKLMFISYTMKDCWVFIPLFFIFMHQYSAQTNYEVFWDLYPISTAVSGVILIPIFFTNLENTKLRIYIEHMFLKAEGKLNVFVNV